jgi:transcriptional regulator with XRE-family HTH domain
MTTPVYLTKKHIDHEKTGALVRRLRTKKLMSLATLSELTGLDRSYLSYLERGDRAWSEELFIKVHGELVKYS